MPSIQLLNPTAVVWDRQLIYPRVDIGGALGALPYGLPVGYLGQDTLPTERTAAIQNEVYRSSKTTGGGVWQLWAGNGILNLPALSMPHARISCNPGGNLARGLEGIEMQVGPAGASLPAGAALPSIERVFWLRVLFGQQTTHNPPLAQTRFLMTPVSDTHAIQTPDQLVGINNAGGFGFRGNGVDGWEYVSYSRAGVELVLEAVPFPAHNPATWNLFELVRYNQRPGVNATVEVYLNQELVVVRDFLAGLIEPLAQHEYAYRPVVQAMSGVADQSLDFTIDARWGRFNRQGIEIQG